MTEQRSALEAETKSLVKCPTGIAGLDEVTHGGLPQGRPTLVCGGAGCGKTLLAMKFLVRGIVDFNEPDLSNEEKVLLGLGLPLASTAAEEDEMTTDVQLTPEQLQALRDRLAATEERLAEAEETLAAIRNGEISYGRLWVHKDITERKQIEEALRKSEQRVTEILESIREGSLPSTPSGASPMSINPPPSTSGSRRKRWSEKYLGRLSEYPRHRPGDAVPQGDDQAHPLIFELKGVLTPKWYEIRCYPTTDGLSVYCIDTTARKLAEEALRESEERFRALAENVPDIVVRFHKD